LIANNKLYLSKIGYVRIFIYRSLTVKYEVDEWYVIFIVEKEVQEQIDINIVSDNRIKAIELH